MANSLRQRIIAWCDLEENKEAVQTVQLKDEKKVEKLWKKSLKDLSVNESAADLKFWWGVTRQYLREGNKQGSLVNVSTKAEIDVKDIELELWKPGTQKLDKNLFEKYETKKGIDILYSTQGGIPKASTFVVVGGPGVGKTTVCADTQKALQDNYPNAKIACVQAEMKKFDILYEQHENKMPWMSDLNYILLKDENYGGYQNVKNTLKKIFTSGFDILFVDSIENIVKLLVTYASMRRTEAENFMLELFDKANEGRDNKNEQGKTVCTTIIAIQQVTKGGDFKGDNALMHETTGMMYFDKDEKGHRFIEFEKNRRCGGNVNKRLYFSLEKENQNHVKYNLELFTETETQMDFITNEKAEMDKKADAFFSIFNKSKKSETTTEVVEG